MISNSAFITVGEPKAVLDEVAAGRAPGAEYAVLRSGYFSRVEAMVDTALNPRRRGSFSAFALMAYRRTWHEENIYLGEEFPGIQYLAVHAALRRRKRIAMLIHNVTSLRRRLPLVTLRLSRLLDHVLCLSQQSQREVESIYGIDRSRITVIGSRVDTEFFKPDPAVPVEEIVSSAGVVNRDYRTLVEAMRPLGVSTKIAADTAWRYSAGAPIIGALPPFVEMRSWGSYANLRSLYARSAVVVVPLQRPMLSGVTVVLEAMAMGKPVVLTHSPHVDDFLRDREHGFFVPAGDESALREKIRYLLDHPAEAARMGARGREWVLERFTVPQYVARILSVWHR
jgi:glycosyltransferase involved in cell wall biosynthesis